MASTTTAKVANRSKPAKAAKAARTDTRTPVPQDEIASAVAARRAWAEGALAGWVRCASVLGDEREAQVYAEGLLCGLGLEVRRELVDLDTIRDLPGYSPVDWTYGEGRHNVVGLHRPTHTTGGRSLIINGHVDVVSPEPAALWSTPPFSPVVVQDAAGERWMRGRGAGDMKGGTVAALWGLAALSDLGLSPAAPLTVQSVIEEECTGNGTLALCAAGYRADGCLIPEPFAETVLGAQVGVLWFDVHLLGKTTHVLGAGRGVNAIEKSFVVIAALRALEDEVNNRPDAVPPAYRGVDHPINLNVGIIAGGDWGSTVAGACTVRLRFGLFPGERCAEMMARVEARVAEAAAGDPWLRESPPSVSWVGFQAQGCEVDLTSPLCTELGAVHRSWRGGDPQVLRATCTTDVRHFVLHQGTAATCYGPRAEAIHGADEQVSLSSMRRVAEVYADFITRWCGVTRRAA